MYTAFSQIKAGVIIFLDPRHFNMSDLVLRTLLLHLSSLYLYLRVVFYKGEINKVHVTNIHSFKFFGFYQEVLKAKLQPMLQP